jgi:hypothetical protein
MLDRVVRSRCMQNFTNLYFHDRILVRNNIIRKLASYKISRYTDGKCYKQGARIHIYILDAWNFWLISPPALIGENFITVIFCPLLMIASRIWMSTSAIG